MKNKNSYRLFSCLWELTLKCNLHCIHCGSVAGPAREKELTLSECFRVADEIIELNCEELTFIGGEIFLFPGWEKVARHLSDNGVIVNLMSNGYCIGNKEIDQIKYGNLSNVGISLDGTEAVHNYIRGNNHSFSHICDAFDLLNKAAIPIGVVTSLMEMNYQCLEDLYKILLDNNVNLWQIQLVNPMGNMSDKKNMILDRNHVPELIDFISEKNKDKTMLVVAADNVGYYYDDNEARIRGTRAPMCYWEGCAAGITSLFIDSVGNVKGCGALYDKRFIEGNLKENSLSEIWTNEGSFAYNRKFRTDMLSGDCRNCDVNDVCKGGCRASNFFVSDSLYENAFCAHFKNS